MSDDFTPSQANAPAIEMPAKRPGLLGSAGGKVVAVIIGIAVLFIIAGIVAAIVFWWFGNKDGDKFVPVVAQPETTATATTSGETQVTAPIAAAPAKPVANDEVFTFRDIFEPLIKKAPEPTGGTGGTDGTDGATGDAETPTTQGTLYLNDISTENGELRAHLTLDGQSYTLGVGDSIPGTPWQVLRITSTQVTMLFGDTQVVLTIGQGVTK